MNNRTLIILAGLLAVAGAWLWWSQTRTPEIADAVAGEALLPELRAAINDVNGITVRADGGELLAEVVRDGDGWRVANRWHYPADAATIRRVLIALAQAERREARTADPEQYHRLGLNPVATGNPHGLELEIRGLATPLAVVVGREAPAGAGSYVRRTDEARTWIVSEVIPRPRRTGDWLDAELLDIPVGEVRRATIEPVEGTPIRLTNPARGGRDFEVDDIPPGYRLLTPTMGRSLARVVSELELVDVVAEAHAPSLAPAGVARYETFDGLSVEITTWVGEDAERVDYARLRATAIDKASESRANVLNERWDGWLYRIPDYKHDHASQSLDRIIESIPN